MAKRLKVSVSDGYNAIAYKNADAGYSFKVADPKSPIGSKLTLAGLLLRRVKEALAARVERLVIEVPAFLKEYAEVLKGSAIDGKKNVDGRFAYEAREENGEVRGYLLKLVAGAAEFYKLEETETVFIAKKYKDGRVNKRARVSRIVFVKK